MPPIWTKGVCVFIPLQTWRRRTEPTGAEADVLQRRRRVLGVDGEVVHVLVAQFWTFCGAAGCCCHPASASLLSSVWRYDGGHRRQPAKHPLINSQTFISEAGHRSELTVPG